MKHSCRQCKDIKKVNKERVNNGDKMKSSYHCHCPQWTPSDELVAEVSRGKPYQDYKTEERNKQEKAKAQAISFSVAKEKDVDDQKKDLEKEVTRFKKKIEYLKQSKVKDPVVPVPSGRKEVDRVAERKRKKKERDDKIAAKRNKLSFIL